MLIYMIIANLLRGTLASINDQFIIILIYIYILNVAHVGKINPVPGITELGTIMTMVAYRYHNYIIVLYYIVVNITILYYKL